MPVRILHLEDVPEDAELVRESLAAEGIECEVTWVNRRDQFVAALEEGSFDLILADYGLPGFDGGAALALARERVPEVPFLVLSGTVGEEIAVEMLQRGATDYLLKHRTARLGPAVRRALREAEEQATRRRTEQALEASRLFFQHVAEATPNVIYVYDLLERRHLYVAGASRSVWGYGGQQVLEEGPAFLERCLHPDDRARLRENLARFASAGEGEVFESQYRFRHSDGSWRWLRTRATLFTRAADGAPRQIVGVAEDVSEHEREEKRRATQHSVTRVLAEATTLDAARGAVLEALGRGLDFDACEWWDLDDGGVPTLTAAWHSSRLQGSELGRAGPGAVLPPASLPGSVSASGRARWIRDAASEPDFARGALVAACGLHAALGVPVRGGRARAVLVAFSREVLDRDEDLLRTLEALGSQLAAFVDRREAEGALRASQERVREQAALLDKARDAILVGDLEGRIRFWNESAERIYGWPADEALGRNAGELFRSESPQARQAWASVLEHGEWIGELEKSCKDGRRIVAESRWTLVRDEAGRPRSVLTIDTDVTEKKQLQSQFLRVQRMESIGTLAGGIAHDLNNVLSPILMALEILRKKVVDERGLRLLATMETSARRGADMVRQILTFARGIEGERIVLQPRHLLRDVEKIAAETFPKTIRVRLDVAGDLWNVTGDATQIHQVLLNLSVNARDAMPDGGVLTLAAENVRLDETYSRMHPDARPGPHVILTVADSGTGIPPGLLDKIFDPFFTTKEVGKGTGLGLSTSLAIVKSHGGFIHVYTEARRGSSFRVYLPATLSAERPGLPAALADLPRGRGEQILVVDDEASIREIARETLETYGYRVLTASDGAEAVAVYTQNAADVAAVLTDVRMPYMDGPATIRALVRVNPAVKVVVASGFDDGETARKDLAGTVRAFLQKPFTAESLLTTLRDVLSQG
ncbi:MAG: response regulator [Acidobacteria bacterium]|nr:response regulator [Acidobacteriota bacterium]